MPYKTRKHTHIHTHQKMGEQLPDHFPLFETKKAKRRTLFKLYASSMAIAISSICVYRATHIPEIGKTGRYLWIGLFMAELWFTFYWLITQLVRWNPVTHKTFKDKLSQKYEKVLPGVDIFVCTADAVIEPPLMVINTVLSMMAYDYPPEKVNVYLSDDGGSELTFYAVLEASRFCKFWLPFCKRYKIEPRSPSAYFASASPINNEWLSIKNRYEEMRKRIDDATRLGKVAEELRKDHKGFQEWDFGSNKNDHQPIIQILIDQRDPGAKDADGKRLPGLVYVAREKRREWHHNFKAGAMNTLIRVSSLISNNQIILNVDCDMYSNNSESIRDAMCFFLDEERSQRIAFVQFPQNSENLTKNDLYSNHLRVINAVELGSLDSYGGCPYIGSGCFHRRDTLCGRIYSVDSRINWETENHKQNTESIDVLEKECKILASCSYERNTQWGKEMGLKYGCPVEDIITGLCIKCRGWRSVHFNPEREAFLGLAPITLLQTLVQTKRWSEGDFQIFLSKYCPFIYGHAKLPLKLQISYCCYLLWAANCWATLCYVSVPAYCLLAHISLFPKLSSYWFIPFAYIFVGKYAYSLGEFYYFGGTVKGWWNDQRMWLYRRLTSYLFGFCDVILKSIGFTTTNFIITSKVSEKDVSQRYNKEIMEFGTTSPMFTILSTLALINLFSFVNGLKLVVMDSHVSGFSELAVQMVLCGLIILINLPLYDGMFFRKDNGSMPPSVTYQSTLLAILRTLFKLYASSMAMAIILICVYRATHIPENGKTGRYFWIGLFMAELWFSLYWLITQLVRWNPVTHHTFKEKLSQKYEKIIPGVDIFVCTADAVIEPPLMVINTVLSMMAYDYPPEKVNVYLSDDGGSELTFYALLEASRFCKYWLPFCKRYKIEPRSPSAYFGHASRVNNEWSSVKNKYEEMKKRIDDTTRLGKVAEELRKEHKGFQEWDFGLNKNDHQAIVQILIDQRDPEAKDIDENSLPGLVYVAREKRREWHHNFKAGAMNALIRVSSRISNNQIILNVDCDMYSNNSASVRDAMCFFMDEERSQNIAFVQFPQNFDNLTRNDIYSNSLMVINDLDSYGGCLYVGSGCFHRRDTLCGRIYSLDTRINWEKENHKIITETIDVLENECKILASCSYEHNTQWGKEMGLKYGCPVEDIITGLSIKCRGWRSVHYNPERKGFLGLAPTTLLQTLVQIKRWAEGDFQIFLSKYCPLVYGHAKIPLKLQISYCCYLLWAVNCWATLYYVLVPSYCLLACVSLFPKLSSHWFIPFVYVFIGKYVYSFGEFYYLGGTVKGWWNDQRMWLYRRLTSYLFGFCDVIQKSMGLTVSGFVITSKVSQDDVSQRYNQEIMEFGATSPMFTILSTLALINLFSFVNGVKWVIMNSDVSGFSELAVQMVLCGLIVLINFPLYEGMFFRKDNGSMPSSVTYQSTILAILFCALAII
ncbi:hypothetical protein LXL04_026975 [Taraxacum kok-saghyz]